MPASGFFVERAGKRCGRRGFAPLYGAAVGCGFGSELVRAMVTITRKLEAVIDAHPEQRDRIVSACYRGCSACDATEDLDAAVPCLDAPYMRVYCVRCVRCLPKWPPALVAG
jgi:hypothetical protein